MKIHLRLVLIMLFSSLVFQAQAAPPASGLKTARPESVGMSSERLDRLEHAMKWYIDKDLVAWTVTLVARKGKVVHFEAQGKKDVATGSPLTRDTVFWIDPKEELIGILMSQVRPYTHLNMRADMISLVNQAIIDW